MTHKILMVRPCKGVDTGGFLDCGHAWSKHFDSRGDWVPVESGQPGYHSGRDISCPVGTPMVSPIDGLVLVVGWQDPVDHKVGLGYRLIIKPAVIYLGYDNVLISPSVSIGHMSEIYAVVGAKVRAGIDHIGLSGNTGHTTGPHVHAQALDTRFRPARPLPFDWCTMDQYKDQRSTIS